MGKQVKRKKQSQKKKKMNNRGFTLIELLAVITIMGILMMVAIPAVSRTIENSRRDSFATIAQNYVNAVRQSVMADEIECLDGSGYITASATPNGVYYFEINSDQESAKDLMESGGASSWGGAQVKGYVVWQKADQTTAGGTQTTTKTTYKISLVDKGHHGIPTYETDQKITRAKVVTNVTPPSSGSGTTGTTEPTSGGTGTTTDTNYGEFGAAAPSEAFKTCTTNASGTQSCTDSATPVRCQFK